MFKLVEEGLKILTRRKNGIYDEDQEDNDRKDQESVALPLSEPPHC